MTLIRRSLYEELIQGRADRLTALNRATSELRELNSQKTEYTKFIDSYEATQAALEANIVNLEKSIAEETTKLKALEAAIPALSDAVESTQAIYDKARDKTKSEAELLNEIENNEESTEAQIAAQQKVVDEAEAQEAVALANRSKAESALAANETEGKATKVAIDTNRQTVTETNKQIADNAERKTQYEEELPEIQIRIDETTAVQTPYPKDYNDYVTESKASIDSFEAQQIQRDVNIPKESPELALYRVPTNAEEILESSNVMNEVVLAEFSPSENEKNNLAEYITLGKSEGVNPDFLTADEAKTLTLGCIWSTKDVAGAIKKACEKGLFEISYGELPNNIIYSLQQAGYVVTLGNASLLEGARVIINWQNLGSK